MIFHFTLGHQIIFVFRIIGWLSLGLLWIWIGGFRIIDWLIFGWIWYESASLSAIIWNCLRYFSPLLHGVNLLAARGAWERFSLSTVKQVRLDALSSVLRVEIIGIGTTMTGFDCEPFISEAKQVNYCTCHWIGIIYLTFKEYAWQIL